MLRFGTDGVRGLAFDELSTELARRIGLAAAQVLGGTEAVIGCDTRESGPALRDAVAAGLREAGVRPLDLGVAPTPAVAYIAAQRGAVGVMISASHNPWHDNGIKLFTAAGTKLSDGEQAAIEALLHDERLAPGTGEAAHGAESGAPIESIQPDIGRWVRAVASTASTRFDGLHVVVDAANGAASYVAGPLLADLGARVTMTCDQPDGRNINAWCGSTHPESVAEAVLGLGADLGVALDGDADRLVCVDHRGRVVDGDHLMAILATDLRTQGRLYDDTVVVTVMSNLGFHKAMRAAGVRVHVTPVGDRHILEAMSTHGFSFGGEQSGHLVFGDLAVTGDGLLSAVQLLDVMARTSSPLADLADAAMTSFPQVLENVRVAELVADPAAAMGDEIAAVEAELGDDGRVLVRASGTEPVIRVMVEAADEATARRVVAELCDVVHARFG